MANEKLCAVRMPAVIVSVVCPRKIFYIVFVKKRKSRAIRLWASVETHATRWSVANDTRQNDGHATTAIQTDKHVFTCSFPILSDCRRLFSGKTVSIQNRWAARDDGPFGGRHHRKVSGSSAAKPLRPWPVSTGNPNSYARERPSPRMKNLHSPIFNWSEFTIGVHAC